MFLQSREVNQRAQAWHKNKTWKQNIWKSQLSCTQLAILNEFFILYHHTNGVEWSFQEVNESNWTLQSNCKIFIFLPEQSISQSLISGGILDFSPALSSAESNIYINHLYCLERKHPILTPFTRKLIGTGVASQNWDNWVFTFHWIDHVVFFHDLRVSCIWLFHRHPCHSILKNMFKVRFWERTLCS